MALIITILGLWTAASLVAAVVVAPVLAVAKDRED